MKNTKGIVVVIGILAVVIGIIGVKEYRDMEAKSYLKNGINAINSGNYIEAENDMKHVLKTDNSNKKAKDVINIVSSYTKVKEDLNSKNLEKAQNDLKKMPRDYGKYKIKENVESLINQINIAENKEKKNNI